MAAEAAEGEAALLRLDDQEVVAAAEVVLPRDARVGLEEEVDQSSDEQGALEVALGQRGQGAQGAAMVVEVQVAEHCEVEDETEAQAEVKEARVLGRGLCAEGRAAGAASSLQSQGQQYHSFPLTFGHRARSL